jgi:hypothetical protein
MSAYVLCIFLLLFGVMEIVSTNIPHWVLGAVAIAAAVALIVKPSKV